MESEVSERAIRGWVFVGGEDFGNTTRNQSFVDQRPGVDVPRGAWGRG